VDCRSSLVLSHILPYLQQVGYAANPGLASRPGPDGYPDNNRNSNANACIQQRAAVDFNTISNFGQR
jgi:hypothetical protein